MSSENKSDILLGERQRQFIAFVLCFAGVLTLGCLVAALIYILNQAFSLFAGVIWSLALSGMLAILLRPLVSLLEVKIGLSRVIAILALYCLVIASAGGITWFLGAKVLQQSQEFIGDASAWPERLEEKGKQHLPPDTWNGVSGHFLAFKDYWQNMLAIDGRVIKLDLSPAHKKIYNVLDVKERAIFHNLDALERAEFFELNPAKTRKEYLVQKNLERKNQSMEIIEKQSGQIAVKSAEVLQSAWDGLLGIFTQITFLAVIPIYLFYFLSSNRNLLDDLEKELTFFSDSVREDIIFLLREFVGILVAFFRGQLLIGLLMGIGYAIGFSLSGLKFGITLGLLFGLLNIVPYLGSIVGVCVTLLVAYFQPDGIAESGQWNVLFSCAASFIVVQVIESYYLTPKIMGQQTGLHPVVVIVSIFFWGTALGGILGMIFGIPLTAFIIIAWRLLRRKYFSRATC